VRGLDSLSGRLGKVLATKTKTAGAVPPSVVDFIWWSRGGSNP
jgi:hypothetical protein